eukprot:3798418-Rhodomonas_salina.1
MAGPDLASDSPACEPEPGGGLDCGCTYLIVQCTRALSGPDSQSHGTGTQQPLSESEFET